MLIPDVERCMSAVHEAAHAVAAERCGLTVGRISIDDDRSTGQVGHCEITGECDWREHALVLLAGAVAVREFFPEIDPRLAAATGYADFREAEDYTRDRVPEERRAEVRLAFMKGAERIVERRATEILHLAADLIARRVPVG